MFVRRQVWTNKPTWAHLLMKSGIDGASSCQGWLRESSHHVRERGVTHVSATKNIFQLDSKSGPFPAPSREPFHQLRAIPFRLLPFPVYVPRQTIF
ncbi:hypothetical protein CDAR_401921 [Caerostris darwini]|uniref:Uncharacterized protein n=1 Tax=Caerostris darwini TaxID=1538125 RepID=A0AAV4W0S8_9ARAC|nr:hypothetical protein CDAR_401921 [Caerostris darwini]